ncbi:sensor histidine kinase [Halovenus marina]|uniref:sensor histidine kinase n=1 Tax=Halovenus marina TaxID=3396621 RepID=UPI003F566393
MNLSATLLWATQATGVQTNATYLGYVLGFGIAGVVCLGAVRRAEQVEDDDVRRGLVWLLGTTSAWAFLKVAYFTFPGRAAEPVYIAGLIFGFATVWAWLYFCSAYTGRNYHRDSTLRRLGSGVFLSVVAVKVTNPVHGLYFGTARVDDPFAHVAIEHGVFHWTVTGLSYALAAMGVFMLFELYRQSGYDTRPLAVLTGLIAVPVAVDIGVLFTPVLLDVIYAPLGVAVFVVGVLYVYEREFIAVDRADGESDAAIVLNDEGRIRDYTPAAGALFPELEGAIGEPLGAVVPSVAELIERDEQILEDAQAGETRYYLTTTNRVSLGETTETVVLLSDVTRAERRRRELARHNRQLESLASAMTHELRNLLQIIDWRLAAASDRVDDGTVEHESIETAADTNERMADLVEDFTAVAKYGQTVEHVESVDLGTAARDAWRSALTDGMTLRIETDVTVEADPSRLGELFTNAFEFARHNGAETVTVSHTADGFAIEDDGRSLAGDPDRYLAYGEAVPDAESGMKLPNVDTFARVHGWSVAVEDGNDGIRIEITGVRME